MKSEFIIAGEDQTLRFPYGPGKGSGVRNNGFIDLLFQPERIDEIHELQGFPEVRQLVIGLNTPDCVFRSLRVDSCMDAHVQLGFKHSCYAMITFVFRTPLENDLAWYQWFFSDFQDFAAYHRISDRVRTIFVVNPIVSKSLNYTGVCLDIRIYGDGYTTADARGQWVVGMQRLKESLDRWDSKVRMKDEEATEINLTGNS